MKLITQLNSLLEAKKQSHSFEVKDWDLFAGAMGKNLALPKKLDAKVLYNISSEGDIEDVEVITLNKVELQNDDEVVETLPVGSDVFKFSAYQDKNMWKDIEQRIWKDYEAWVKSQHD